MFVVIDVVKQVSDSDRDREIERERGRENIFASQDSLSIILFNMKRF